MKREEDEEETSSSEEEDEYIPPPIPIEKRVRIIDPKEEADARAAAAFLAAENIGQPSTSSTFPGSSASQTDNYIPPKDEPSKAEQHTTAGLEKDVAQSQERNASASSEELQAPVEAGYSGMPQEQRDIEDTAAGINREASLLGTEEEESLEEILPPVYVEKKVRIIDPKEVNEIKQQEEIQRQTELSVDGTDADNISNRSSETSFLLSYINENEFAEENKLMNLAEEERLSKEGDKISRREGEEDDRVRKKEGEDDDRVRKKEGEDDDKVSKREGEEDDKLSRKDEEPELDERSVQFDERSVQFDERSVDIETQISMSSESSGSSDKSRNIQKHVGFAGPWLKSDSDAKLDGNATEKANSDNLSTLSGFSQTSSKVREGKRVSFEALTSKQGDDDKSNYKYTDLKNESMSGKQSLYSKYVDQSASIMKNSRQSFLYDYSQTEVAMISSSEILADEPHQSDDFTHGYRENKRYIIPPMTEHEIHRLGGNKFLEGVHKVGTEATCGDHIALSLAYMTVNGKRDLKEIFDHISKNMQSIGKVYSARMLGRYHEYAHMFRYSGGNEGIVASMRFTSHCSDIIKSYIQLAALVEEPEEFTSVIMELAKRHAKLDLNLRDHQLHFRPFIEILGSSSEERMQIYSKAFFFVSLVSRAMILAEQKMRRLSSSQDTYAPIGSRSIVKSTKPKPELSRKQPIWD